MTDFPVARRTSVTGPVHEPGGVAHGRGWATAGPGAIPPLDVRTLPRILLLRWWVILPIMLMTAGGSWYWERSHPARYRADATVRLVTDANALAGLSGDVRREESSSSMPSQVEMLRSRAVAAVVVDSVPVGLRVLTQGFPIAVLSNVSLVRNDTTASFELTFGRDGFAVRGTTRTVAYGAPDTVGALAFTIARRPGAVTAGSIALVSRDAAIDAALRQLEAAQRKPTALIDVKFTAGDPEVARRVVNMFLTAYQAADVQLARQQIEKRRVFIEQQIGETDSELAAAEHALSDFRTKQQAYSSQEKFAAQRTVVEELGMQWRQMDAERRLNSTLLTQLVSGDSASRAEALRAIGALSPATMPVVSGLFQQLVRYEMQRIEMTGGPWGYTASHPDVRRLDGLIAESRDEIMRAVQAHIDVLGARMASVDTLRTNAESLLRTALSTEAEQTRLSQNATVLREQASLLRSQYQQARIGEAGVAGSIQIVDLATRARRLIDRSRRVVAFALLLGLLLGSGVAVAMEAADNSVKTRATLETALHLPVLATIPCIDGAPGAPGRLRLPGRAGIRLREAEQRRMIALTAASDPRAPSSEAFRQLRTNLRSGRGQEVLRDVVVTSALPSEGKTMVAINLAIAFAQQQRRVLLVDCDLLVPSLHRVLGLALGPGLEQVVFDGLAPMAVMQAGPAPGLSIVTAGTRVGNGREALGSPRMLTLLRDLRQEFDVVVLDCPPVLGASDALVLGAETDATLFVTRAGSTTIAQVTEALRRLDAAGVYVVGAVLNDADGRMERYGDESYDYAYAERTEVASA